MSSTAVSVALLAIMRATGVNESVNSVPDNTVKTPHNESPKELDKPEAVPAIWGRWLNR